MAERIRDIGEFGAIARINEVIKRDGVASGAVTLAIGDDTASFLPRPGREILATCDSIVEGRHYLPGHTSPFDLGRRAVTVNISDIGAMGGHPLYALISLGLKQDALMEDIEEMYRGFLAELNPFGASIIGGNLTSSETMFIDITLLGEVEEGKGVRRSGAHPGDAILVTGFPGQAAAGLQLLLRAGDTPGLAAHPLVRVYQTPTHRAKAGGAVGKTGRATAMIDTSDGFLGDLGHICEESHVGAELQAGSVPVSDELRDAASLLGQDPHDFFFGASDDYELIITCSPADSEEIRTTVRQCCDAPVARVGRITTGGGIVLLKDDGARQVLTASSWDHFK